MFAVKTSFVCNAHLNITSNANDMLGNICALMAAVDRLRPLVPCRTVDPSCTTEIGHFRTLIILCSGLAHRPQPMLRVRAVSRLSVAKRLMECCCISENCFSFT